MQTRIKLYPADDPHISAIRYELGVDFATLKEMPAAESSLRQVLSAGDKFNSALLIRTLGYVLLEEGKFDDAEKLLLQARNLDIQTLGRPSNEAFYLAMLYAHTGRWDEAAQTIDGRVRWPQLLSAISSLSESEQLSFLQDYLFEVQAALSFGLARPDDSKIGTASTGWLLMNKGLPYQALAERTLLARDSSDPAVAQTASCSRETLETCKHSSPYTGGCNG